MKGPSHACSHLISVSHMQTLPEVNLKRTQSKPVGHSYVILQGRWQEHAILASILTVSFTSDYWYKFAHASLTEVL